MNSTCPSCGGTDFNSVLELKDWFLSEEEFELKTCGICGLVLTYPIPDLDTIGKYYKSDEYISHAESKGLVSSIYRAVQRFTLGQKLRLIKRSTNLNSILDYGAGKGDFLKFCQESGVEAHGFEPDSDARSLAKEKNGLVLNTSIEPMKGKIVDAITMWHVLEHIPNPNEIVQNLKSLLSDSGRLVIAVPNHSSYDARFYGKFWAAYDVPRHLTHFSPDSFEAFAKKNELEVESIHPMWFDSTYVSMLSEKYLRKFDNGPAEIIGLVRSVIIGAISNLVTLFNRSRCSSVIYVCKKAK